jgi:hypothetical protein
MNCCSECFNSTYIKAIINSYKTKGDCDFCGSKNTNIYSPRELGINFSAFLEIYEVDNDEGLFILDKLKLDFQNLIFSTKIEDPILLLRYILDDDFESYKPLFEEKISLKIKNDNSHSQTIENLNNRWEEFSNEIKNINRFHIQNIIDLEKIKEIFSQEELHKTIPKGRIFYRGRISDENGFTSELMNQPPPEKATAGRANPIGIPYLYIADQIKTTLYETRASLNDFVTIAEFQVTEELKILNLNNIEEYYDPIKASESESLTNFLIYLPFINKLKTELSKPNRRNDKEQDYLPTQYLAEYIKYLGYDGVEYKSSLYSEGFNFAVFNPQKLNCIKVYIKEITEIDYKFETFQK